MFCTNGHLPRRIMKISPGKLDYYARNQRIFQVYLVRRCYYGDEASNSILSNVKKSVRNDHEDNVKRPLEDTGSGAKKLWEDPWKFAKNPGIMYGIPRTEYKTQYVESKDKWHLVERLLPKKTIPIPPKHDSYPTPSGWRPPKSPPPDLPYRVRRTRYHLFPLYLECRRDQLNPKTMEYEYDELVLMKRVEGDVFACEKDLREFLQERLGHPVATHVNEIQGTIRVRHADRTDLEAFLFEKGF